MNHQRINEYIKDLLLRDGTVTINTIGTLTLHYHQASISEETLVPPANEVRFDTSLTQDQTLLSYIMFKEQMSFVEAETAYNNWLKTFNWYLKTQKPYLIPQIGEFIPQGRQITFSTLPDSLVNSPYYALPTLEILPKPQTESGSTTTEPVLPVTPPPVIVETAPAQHIILEADQEPVTNLASTSSVEPTPPVVVATSTPQKKKSSFVTLLMWILLGLLLAGAIVVALKWDTLFKTSTPSTTITSPIQDTVKKVSLEATKDDSIETSLIDSLNKTVEKALPQLKPTIDTIKEQPEQQLKFYLIAGVFKSEENAKKLAKSLRAQGFKSHVLRPDEGKPQNRYKVSYGGFLTYNEANYFRQFIHKTIDQKAWISER